MSDALTLRRRVRADRHATSYPLIVVGAVGFHYASAWQLSWLSPLYGIPLAFVVVWALQRRTEREVGVGRGGDEALIVAFAVFMAASLFGSGTWRMLMPWTSEDISLFWMLTPAAVGLGAIGRRHRDRLLLASAAVIVVGCAVGELLGESFWQVGDSGVPWADPLAQLAFVIVVAAGLLAYRRERAIAES